MKYFLLLSLLCFCGCSEPKPKPLPERYSATYEILYPSGSKVYTIQTKKGKARVGTYSEGFFHNGTLMYYVGDDSYESYDKEQYPIRIIKQHRIQ